MMMRKIELFVVNEQKKAKRELSYSSNDIAQQLKRITQITSVSRNRRTSGKIGREKCPCLG